MVVGSTILVVAVESSTFALAAQKAAISQRAKVLVPLLVAALLSAWSGWAITSVRNLVITPEPPTLGGLAVQAPSLLIVMSVMSILGIVAIFTSKTVRAVNAATPPAWIIAVQAYRVEGLMFLWPFLASRSLPAGFAIPAGVGDVLTGLFAPLVALGIARNRPNAYKWAILWNWFGILDLVVAVTMAVVTQTANIARFPLVIVPLFLGPPLGIITHIYSLRNLRATRGSSG